MANRVGQPGSGFASDTNEVILLSRDRDPETWPLLTKAEVARRLLDHLHATHFAGRETGVPSA